MFSMLFDQTTMRPGSRFERSSASKSASSWSSSRPPHAASSHPAMSRDDRAFMSEHYRAHGARSRSSARLMYRGVHTPGGDRQVPGGVKFGGRRPFLLAPRA